MSDKFIGDEDEAKAHIELMEMALAEDQVETDGEPVEIATGELFDPEDFESDE